MPQSNATIRQSERRLDTGAHGVATTRRVERVEPDAQQQLPLSASPPLSVATPRPAAPISGSGVNLRVHSDLEAVREEWKAFEQRADRTVFQSFDWLATWQREIGARNGTILRSCSGTTSTGSCCSSCSSQSRRTA